MTNTIQFSQKAIVVEEIPVIEELRIGISKKRDIFEQIYIMCIRSGDKDLELDITPKQYKRIVDWIKE